MYALKVTGYNQDMAEDAVHNAFISIIKEKEKYFNPDSRDFRFSAVDIVRNKCIDLLRKEKVYADISIDELEIYYISYTSSYLLLKIKQFTKIVMEILCKLVKNSKYTLFTLASNFYIKK